ncbi:REC114 meiotic recombination protein [Homo sapiens]|uniref:HCG40828, isoform CRA_a n=1 Tax=Homo sapiens TaxID=9606 RepID=H0YKR2_HUMAN|nr:meiotic recombination protein REC114 isoform 2 [Homo sapiens]EAW77927.1 hCG40828, isoform CRA_a [Homo sapiens]KAI2575030.1 REC114 meiotic recombination protein [Homo sapiens]KAI4058631.1 REC114 meiotic recombination protein [Homo sapiens]|eukprot:NP_001335701.1 meiotic recombination protein REC114 isoform 2 [Homo sapiens]
MAEAGKVPLSLGLTGGEAAEWPLQRYARCIPSNTRDPPGPCLEAGTAPCPTWKVFDSNEESGYLVLTIVISGHFFIFQGQTLLDKSRLFRVQFSGESKEQALEHCCSCVQKLAQYITVQVPDGNIQELQLIPGPPRATESQGKDSAKSVPRQPGSHQHSEQQQVCVTAGTGAPDGRTSLTQLAQTLLASEELPHVYEQSAWGAEELGPFLRLCLMDQNFPAFVEEVEKELKKLAGLRN